MVACPAADTSDRFLVTIETVCWRPFQPAYSRVGVQISGGLPAERQSENHPEHDAPDHDGQTEPRPGRRQAQPPSEVPVRQANRARKMRDHVQGERSEPEVEDLLVHKQSDAICRPRAGGQDDAAGEHCDGENAEHRPEHAQHRRRRPLAPVLSRSPVVAGHAPDRADQLQDHQRHQNQADHDVQREQRARPKQHRDDFGHEQYQENQSGGRGEPGVRLSPGRRVRRLGAASSWLVGAQARPLICHEAGP